ncbi:MAG TPA: VOC family protein [Burkholderiales bacterium]|nr:VOC family protein [Burkholderiales bacterium]
MPNPIVHFEIPADDVARAQTFYQNVFGWKIKQMSMPSGPEYYGVTTRKEGEAGINGGLMKRNMPGQPFANYVAVKSIDDFLAKVTANGGSVIMPRQEIAPGMGSIAVFKDTEENMMGLYQPSKQEMKKAPAKTTAKKAKKAKKRTRR